MGGISNSLESLGLPGAQVKFASLDTPLTTRAQAQAKLACALIIANSRIKYLKATLIYNEGNPVTQLHILFNSPMIVLNIIQLIIVINTVFTPLHMIMSSMHASLAYLHILLVQS